MLLWSAFLGATEPREALEPQLCMGAERVSCPWTVPLFTPEVHKSCCGVERDAASLLSDCDKTPEVSVTTACEDRLSPGCGGCILIADRELRGG